MESMMPSAHYNEDVRDQINAAERFRTRQAPPEADARDKKVALHLSVSVNDIVNIDLKNECFRIRFRYILMWEANLAELGLAQLVDKALADGHRHTLSADEEAELERKMALPSVYISNRVAPVDKEGDRTIVVYGGGAMGTAVSVQSEMYYATCRQKFNLRHFPFDLLELSINFKLVEGRGRASTSFRLVVTAVQFHRQAMDFSEYTPHSPLIKTSSSAGSGVNVCLAVERRSEFYVYNVWGMLSVLSWLCLTGFVVDSHHQGERTVITVTLLLSAIAFKFSLNDVLPAVPYFTHMDLYIFASVMNISVISLLVLFPAYWYYDTQFYMNLALGLFSVVILALSSIWWFDKARRIQASHVMTKPIVIAADSDKSWYSFHFHKAEYLPPPTEDSEFSVIRAGKTPSSSAIAISRTNSFNIFAPRATSTTNVFAKV